MKFSLWTDYGALNSKPVFDAFANSLNVTLGILLFITIVVPTLIVFGVFFFTAAWLETSKFGNTTNLQ